MRAWFDAYLEVFAACGREGGDDVARLLDFYDVPLVLTSDAGVSRLATEVAVRVAAQQQADALRSSGYDHSHVVDSRLDVLNGVTAIYRCRLSRRRRDASEIGQLGVTYLITDGAAGRRICALVLHGG